MSFLSVVDDDKKQLIFNICLISSIQKRVDTLASGYYIHLYLSGNHHRFRFDSLEKAEYVIDGIISRIQPIDCVNF